jgi:hypothetical protein
MAIPLQKVARHAARPLRAVARFFDRGEIPERCTKLYFESVRAEYLSQAEMPGSRADAKAAAIAKELEHQYKTKEQGFTLTDALLYERVVSRLIPFEALKRKVMTTRGRYRRLASAEEFQGYLDTSPPNPLEATEAEVQADLDDLLGRMQRIYVLSPFREEMRSRISLRIVEVLVITITALALLAWKAGQFPTLYVAIFAGLIGGMVSVQQRIQSAPPGADAIRSVMSLSNGLLSVYLSPVIGAISAGLFFMLLLGGYLKGDLFPELTSASAKAGPRPLSLYEFLDQSGPSSGVWYAKLIIWSFLAGFAERLVPDTLTRFVNAMQSSEGQPPRPVAEVPSGGGSRPSLVRQGETPRRVAIPEPVRSGG